MLSSNNNTSNTTRNRIKPVNRGNNRTSSSSVTATRGQNSHPNNNTTIFHQSQSQYHPSSSSSMAINNNNNIMASSSQHQHQNQNLNLTPKLERSRTSSNTTSQSTSSNSIPQNIIDSYLSLITTPSRTPSQLRSSLSALRLLILQHGIPSLQTRFGSLRSCIWKILVGVYKVDVVEYQSLVSRGPCAVSEKIENDIHRTLTGDFVHLDALRRVLHAFVWKEAESKQRLCNLRFGYVQGMNVLAAPWVEVCGEVDGAAGMTVFMKSICPLYVQPALEGVHLGVKLLDTLLHQTDPILHAHLHSKGATTQIWAFPLVMTLSASTPPLKQVLVLWDFLMAYGVHLHLVCLVWSVVEIRDVLLQSHSPMRVLKGMRMNDARRVIEGCMALVEGIEEEMYDCMVRHCYDPTVYEVIMTEM